MAKKQRVTETLRQILSKEHDKYAVSVALDALDTAYSELQDKLALMPPADWHSVVEKAAAGKKKKVPQPRWDQSDAPFCSEDCPYNCAGQCSLWIHSDVYETCKPVVSAMVTLLDKLAK
jgi:hypothetical protein